MYMLAPHASVSWESQVGVSSNFATIKLTKKVEISHFHNTLN